VAEKPRIRIFAVVIATIVLVALIVLSLVPGSPLSHLTTPLSGIFNPVIRLGQKASDAVTGWFSTLAESNRIRNENEALMLENARLRNELTQLEDAARQFEELREALDLKTLYPSYDVKGGYILNRAIGQWFDVFRINLGQSDGLVVTSDISYAVVDAESNLIGRVFSSDLGSAKVLPVIHEGFSISARIDRSNGVAVRVRGDLELKDDNFCLADQIPLDAGIVAGDRIVTSGAGGFFPEGILVGIVESVRLSPDGRTHEAILTPAASFDRTNVVFVLIGREASP
jgi:rod shape-determining protein MreC